ncbi:unnamed protein product [Adineta steineri]|uniref:Uncharacterized protein n=1 Tax=Adineta steineri TaxID=433720 RepID=A0A815SZP6_9BILA|nr:unnamed protein product [Adineta steineri]CAF1643809.1 unnamed protein product [Adineta steineri]
MMSDSQISERLRDLGWNPPVINETNRMYGLAVIYNNQMDQSMGEDELQMDSQQILGHSLYNVERHSVHSQDIEDAELARLSEIFEREYYGYVADTKLIEAMDSLLIISETNKPNENDDFSHLSIQILDPLHASNADHTQTSKIWTAMNTINLKIN